ncbi:MAG: glycosyltransferase [Pirellulales bacterium]|nr:glycosyltransferase [Pirellulales bacterium]
MSGFLSVLLPVRNVQGTLADTVHEILELVSECTKDFELLIIDDGSTDATSEVITEITRAYPQVRAVCLVRSQGRESVLRQALLFSRGELVLLYEEEGGLPLAEIARAWKAAPGKPRLLPADASTGRSATGSVRFEGVHASSGKTAPGFSRKRGFRLVDRRTMGLWDADSRPAEPNFLQRERARRMVPEP